MVLPKYIGSEIYRDSSYAPWHPLRIPRVSLTTDLVRSLEWLPQAQYVDSPQATAEQLARFHDADYIAAVIAAERTQSADQDTRRRFNIGTNGNPIFPEMFRRPATASGGSIHAATLLRQTDAVFSPAGGTHHGRANAASGFCYFNDPVLAICALLDDGHDRIGYVDVDAHHGDGVQDAFHDDHRVLTISVHEAGRWPGTGSADDRAGGVARNLPVPAGFNDAEMAHLMDLAILPLLDAFAPSIVVLQCGADALSDDPLSKLELSNNALWDVVEKLHRRSAPLLVLGGGGYNPWSLARCWAGVWAILNRRAIPAVLPDAAKSLLSGVEWRHRLARNPPDRWFESLADPPNRGPVREAVKKVAAQAVAE